MDSTNTISELEQMIPYDSLDCKKIYNFSLVGLINRPLLLALGINNISYYRVLLSFKNNNNSIEVLGTITLPNSLLLKNSNGTNIGFVNNFLINSNWTIDDLPYFYKINDIISDYKLFDYDLV